MISIKSISGVAYNLIYEDIKINSNGLFIFYSNLNYK